MTQIKIEVPANDHIALSAMADALQRIATERAPSVTVGSSPVELTESFTRTVTVGDESITETTVKPYQSTEFYNGSNTEQLNAELEHASQQVDADEEVEASIHHENTKHDEEREQLDDTLDADGLPWDKRIHSRGKTRLSDNTWRLARKPNDKTDEEWSAYVESVKSELKAVQDIPTLDEQAVADLTLPVFDEPTAPTLTPPVIDTDTPNGMSEANETPVAPVTPPTSLTPQVEAPSDQPSVTTFQELMLYITGNAKKRGADNDMIKATLAEVDPALTAIPLIATRADLIPKFVTALEAKLS